jgi:hypothetical protein
MEGISRMKTSKNITCLVIENSPVLCRVTKTPFPYEGEGGLIESLDR